MTKGKSVASWAKAQMGTPYDEVDCIKLVVQSIRNGDGASGESLNYQCGGTNELWRSLDAKGKYRYVTKRLELETAKSLGLLVPGALLAIWEAGYNQKYDDFEGDCSHIGIYVGDKDCEIIHSSATRECVAASTLRNGWTHVLVHRLIDLENGVDEAEELDYDPLEKPIVAMVETDKDPLTIRDKPSTKGNKLGKVKRGGTMTIVGVVKMDDDGNVWYPVEAQPDNRRGIVRGWAAAKYLTAIENGETESAPVKQTGSLGSVSIPREDLLALADAVNAVDDGAGYNASAYLHAMEALIDAAKGLTQYLKGDD